MEIQKKFVLLQKLYLGIIADAARQFTQHGILDRIIEQRKEEQMLSGRQMAELFGIHYPVEVFEILSEVFGCATWKTEQTTEGFSAETENCKLCALCKMNGANSPCRLYCLNPMESMIKAINPDSSFNIKETLWDGQRCRVIVE